MSKIRNGERQERFAKERFRQFIVARMERGEEAEAIWIKLADDELNEAVSEIIQLRVSIDSAFATIVDNLLDHLSLQSADIDRLFAVFGTIADLRLSFACHARLSEKLVQELRRDDDEEVRRHTILRYGDK